MTKSEWIDITLPLGKEIPILPGEYSADESKRKLPVVDRLFDVDKGDKVTMSYISMSSHDGTHIDSPLHFIPGGSTIDLMPIETTVGPARVIEIKNDKEITTEELEPYDIRTGERILFKTKNSPRAYATRQYHGDLVTISPDAARYLAGKKIRLVGMDYMTIADSDPIENVSIVHKAFLENGVFIIEGLNMAGVEPGDYDLVCLPLRLEKGDAGPCRAVIKPIK
jgi:arylformamidase